MYFFVFQARSRDDIGNACQPTQELAFFSCLERQEGESLKVLPRLFRDRSLITGRGATKSENRRSPSSSKQSKSVPPNPTLNF